MSVGRGEGGGKYIAETADDSPENKTNWYATQGPKESDIIRGSRPIPLNFPLRGLLHRFDGPLTWKL